MVTLNLTYGSEGRVKLQTMTEPGTPNLLLLSINSPDLYQSQERPLASGVDMSTPVYTVASTPLRGGVIGTAQLVAHEAGDSILCCERSDAHFSNDFGRVLVKLS